MTKGVDSGSGLSQPEEPPQSECSRSRRASRAGGANTPVDPGAGVCATKRPVPVGRGLQCCGPQSTPRVRDRTGCRCTCGCPAGSAAVRYGSQSVRVQLQPQLGSGSSSKGNPDSRWVTPGGLWVGALENAGCGVRTCPMGSGRLRGGSGACVRHAPFTWLFQGC